MKKCYRVKTGIHMDVMLCGERLHYIRDRDRIARDTQAITCPRCVMELEPLPAMTGYTTDF